MLQFVYPASKVNPLPIRIKLLSEVFNSTGWISPGAVVDYDFKNNRYFGPTITTSRASSAYVDDAAGNWTLVPPNTLRRSNKGVLIEGAQTNSIRNNSMQGAVAGSPGTLPTNWAASVASTGLARQVVGTGTENGVDYIDIRFSGTVGTAGNITVFFDTNVGISAATGQLWSANALLRIVAGSLNGVTSTSLGMDELNSSSAFVVGGTGTVSIGSGGLGSQRYSYNRTLSGGATVTYVQPYFRAPVTAGSAVDITLRIGWPQLEQWSTSVTTVGGASSPIRTTGTAATRAADVVTATLGSALAAPLTFAGVAQQSIKTGNAGLLTLGVSTDRFVSRVVGSNSDQLQTGVVVGNTLQNNATGPGFSTGIRHAFSNAFAAGDLAESIDGGAVVGGVPATMPGSQSALIIGASVNPLNGYIERLAIYPTRQSNTNLQTLSTLQNWGG